MPTIMMDVRIYTLVHKELTGELSSDEAIELSTLKNQGPAFDVAQDLSLIWNASKEYFPTTEWNAAGAKADFMQRIKADNITPQVKTSSSNVFKYAAAGLLILALSCLTYYFVSSDTVEVKPKIENIEYASLTDDTKFWVEEGSLVDVVQYSAAERKVSLVGNAIFDVARDTERPFTIDMGKGVFAEVLGTSFKATSAHDGGTAKISVREGTVRLYTTGAYASEQILKEGQTGELNADGHKNLKYTSTGPVVLSNKDNLSLRNIPLKKAFPTLGKYFGVTFDILNAELSCEYNNTLVQAQSLEELLEGMKASYPEIIIEVLPRSHYSISGGCK